MKTTRGAITCIGGAAIDRKYRGRLPIALGTSNPVSSVASFGGVARNIVENLARLGVSGTLISVLGDDEHGRTILHHLTGLGVDTHHCVISADYKTAQYVAVLEPDGSLLVGLADMAILDTFTPSLLVNLWPEISSAGWIFADCNLPEATLTTLIELTRRGSPPLAIDAVSTTKVCRLPRNLEGIEILFLNVDEANTLLREDTTFPLTPEEAAKALLKRGASRVVLTCGADGLIAADHSASTNLVASAASVVDVTGAGDALIAGTLSAVMQGHPLAAAARFGMGAAHLTIEYSGSVRPDLSASMVETHLRHSVNELSYAVQSKMSPS